MRREEEEGRKEEGKKEGGMDDPGDEADPLVLDCSASACCGRLKLMDVGGAAAGPRTGRKLLEAANSTVEVGCCWSTGLN